MASYRGTDPIEAMERFVGRIAPHDPDPEVTVMSVELRIGRSRGSFPLTARAAHAFAEALARYTDPDDHGSCTNCGQPLNKDLHCAGCGHLDGIFGQTVADHVADVLRRQHGEPG